MEGRDEKGKFAKGNLFSMGLKNSGRPAKYSTGEEILEIAAEYFDQVTTKSGICKPTISGLCFYLGFESRQSFHDYSKNKTEFSYALKSCHLFIQMCYENNLHTFNSSGSIFALKNLNSEFWKDKSEQDVHQRLTTVTFVDDGDTDSKA